ncbi:MAG: beta-1,6-N-acetylglucosaminyltransferase [Bacteroidales bacterium]|nr:beta-1,6-N-acetylglucosaminyltransferase [Bacteroidales bacterium]
MKHAYLILAHADFVLLQRLVSALDDARNDIFVHIDRKVKELPSLETKHAGLFMLEDRVDVCWGDISVVEAEYKLFEAAIMNDVYAYYHLLSGADLPLKSQDAIHKFFMMNRGKEFIGFSTYNCVEEVRRKVNRWHLFPRDFKNRSQLKRALRAGFLRLQEMLHIERNKQEIFRKGTQWVSVTDGFARHLVAAKPWVMKTFTHTFCPDEIYKQTLCWASGFRQRIYDLYDEGNGCMRAIGWKDGTIRDWTMEDYDELKASNMLFARKFSSRHMDIVEKICESL